MTAQVQGWAPHCRGRPVVVLRVRISLLEGPLGRTGSNAALDQDLLLNKPVSDRSKGPAELHGESDRLKL